MNGVVLFDGPSQLDGTPIVAIATFLSRNRKTGNMVQTWILPQVSDPVSAVKIGDDHSVCGDCPLRSAKACYVNVGQAPLQVYWAWQRGRYPQYDHGQHGQLFRDRSVRLGSYGDPVAVPYSIWQRLLRMAGNWTGYTHQWRKGRFWRYRRFLMASCETREDCELAWRSGWRTFRVMPSHDDVRDGEILCPAASGRTTCSRCRLCAGQNGRPHIAIVAHGPAHIVNNFRTRYASPSK